MQSLDLYGTAAQVIPLLFAVLAFELRSFAIPEGREGVLAIMHAATPILLLGLLVLGEVAAIHALAIGCGSTAARRAVLAALFAGGMVICISMVGTVMQSLLTSSAIDATKNVIVVGAVAAWLLFS